MLGKNKGTTEEINEKIMPAQDEITKYIRSVQLRKQLFGVNEEDLWTVVSNIQKHYEKKADHDAAIIDKLTKDIADKDELIAKQKMYIDAARRKYDTESEK
jgi:tetrahydromethanopterin S-methyltransferase subunit F